MTCVKETNLERAKEKIREILSAARIPYADVICYKGEEEILRLVYGENATGTENLQMFSCSKPITSFAATVPAAIWQRFSVLWQKTRD